MVVEPDQLVRNQNRPGLQDHPLGRPLAGTVSLTPDHTVPCSVGSTQRYYNKERIPLWKNSTSTGNETQMKAKIKYIEKQMAAGPTS